MELKNLKPTIGILSFGGGQDSTTILLKYIYESIYKYTHFLVIMSDTGDEHPYTYSHVKKMQQICNTRGIEFVFLTNNMGFHRDSWQDLISPQTREFEGEEFKPSFAILKQKSCTEQLKIGPIYKFIDEWINEKMGYGFKIQPKGRGCRKQAIKKFGKENGNIDVMIGFAKGEEKRMNSALRLQINQRSSKKDIYQKYINRIFPLIDMEMGRKECQTYILEKIGHVPFPSNCMRCPFMAPEELLWLHVNYEEKYNEWVKIEEKKLAWDKYKWPGKKSLPIFLSEMIPTRLKKIKEKYAHLGQEDLRKLLDDFKMNHGCGSGGY